MKNLMWTFALLVSLLFLAFAYYMRSSTVRAAIDARVPWVAENIGSRIQKSDDSGRPASKSVAQTVPAPAEAAVVPSVPSAPPEPEIFDLNKMAADRASWPAKVTLHKATNFPAVVNNKVVGSLIAPAGTEVLLVKIGGGKLGVEYQGGGAWVGVDETDVIARTGKRRN